MKREDIEKVYAELKELQCKTQKEVEDCECLKEVTCQGCPNG